MRIAVVEPTAAAIAAAAPEPARLVGVEPIPGSPGRVYHLDVGGRPGYPELRVVLVLERGELLSYLGDPQVVEPAPKRAKRRR